MTGTTTSRTGRDDIRSEVHLNWDDPWGSALANLGGLCDLLWYMGADDLIPASAGYSPGMGGPAVLDYPASIYVEMWQDGHITAEDAAYWVHVLDRYADTVPESERY